MLTLMVTNSEIMINYNQQCDYLSKIDVKNLKRLQFSCSTWMHTATHHVGRVLREKNNLGVGVMKYYEYNCQFGSTVYMCCGKIMYTVQYLIKLSVFAGGI